MDQFTRQIFIREGSVEIHGQDISYRQTSENFPVGRDEADPDGETFTFSYERTDAEAAGRPVLFAWNGGPGASSVFVHLGLLAPKRVPCGNGWDMSPLPPYSMIDNPDAILDICDVVVIDAMGTGYGRIYSEEARKYWFTTEHDAEAFVRTIRQWLSAHDRWNSPLYIMGESYGTIRCAEVARCLYMNSSDAMMQHLSGVILLGAQLDYGQKTFPVPKCVLDLPSMAAANWYWNRPEGITLEDFVEAAYAFSYDGYLPALAKGTSIPEKERNAVVERLCYFTGYPAEHFRDGSLELDTFRYPIDRFAPEGRTIGLYDSRFSQDAVKDPDHYDLFCDDACSIRSNPAFLGTMNAVYRKDSNITLDREYRLFDLSTEAGWDFNTSIEPAKSLETAMRRNPKLKLMIGMGYFDMLTTLGWSRYLVNHMDYPADRTYLRYYEAGHMPYLSDHEAARVLGYLREFIQS